jgi:hypothetical protein
MFRPTKKSTGNHALTQNDLTMRDSRLSIEDRMCELAPQPGIPRPRFNTASRVPGQAQLKACGKGSTFRLMIAEKRFVKRKRQMRVEREASFVKRQMSET